MEIQGRRKRQIGLNVIIVGSVPMDEDHLIAALRHVALNPVRARLVARAEDWPHSSVRAHLRGEGDALVRVRPVLDRVARFADLLETDADDPAFMALRRSELIGRPLGSETFIRGAEARLGREPRPRQTRAQTENAARRSEKVI